ncbi:unnamed protein product [Prorocentrum cordatum]|uniref:Uncharacterized protein n=2 Tax=Prorocentrum cordatum TaxID=2364126 RepID=A0ABN9RDV0_9DINO|nr:unnamed protein product [Polarella glacialis]
MHQRCCNTPPRPKSPHPSKAAASAPSTAPGALFCFWHERLLCRFHAAGSDRAGRIRTRRAGGACGSEGAENSTNTPSLRSARISWIGSGRPSPALREPRQGRRRRRRRGGPAPIRQIRAGRREGMVLMQASFLLLDVQPLGLHHGLHQRARVLQGGAPARAGGPLRPGGSLAPQHALQQRGGWRRRLVFWCLPPDMFRCGPAGAEPRWSTSPALEAGFSWARASAPHACSASTASKKRPLGAMVKVCLDGT